MKQNIRVNLIPTFKCNKSCDYCIYKPYLSNTRVADLFWIDSALGTISRQFNIIQITLTGGELSLLSDLYFTMLYNIAKIYCKKIVVETNFIKVNPAIINCCDIINVGYNFDDNLNKTTVYNNIKAASNSDKIINIKTIDMFCKDNPIEIINQLNNLKIKSWEIIPYHMAQNSKIPFKSYTDHEEIINSYLKLSNKMKFAFQNKLQLEGILQFDNYNTKTIFLTPNKTFGIGNFKNNEFFIDETDNFAIILEKMNKMEKKFEKICEKCTSKLYCMSNYFLNLDYKGKSCCGFRNLLENNVNKRGT